MPRAGALLTVLFCAACSPQWNVPWASGGRSDEDSAGPKESTGQAAAASAEAAAPEPQAQPEAEPEPAGPSPMDQAEIRYLLNLAEWALQEDHLTYPAKDSALALYQRVQALDPENDEARRGLERIVERYLELAMRAADRERFEQADALLERARLVDPEHPGISPTQAQIGLLADADRQVIRLDAQRLRERDPELTDSLRQAGLASRGDGCRAQITARDDAEGRWIYQQMSQPGQARIQAQLSIGSPPQVEVMCFPEHTP